MPNWCYTQVCFKGKPENIMRLKNNIELANEWSNRNSGFCNIRYFLSLSDFDTVSYIERFSNRYDCNFRGTVYDTALKPDECGEYLLYYPTLDTAWWIDYQLLQIISMIYDVEYSSYSEEPNMGYYSKCRNGNMDTYNFDYLIQPDYDQLEEAMDDDPQLELDYIIPVKIGEPDTDEVLDELKNRNIEFDIMSIENEYPPNIYGVYYHHIYGVTYDDDRYNKFYKYPELDPFNKLYNKE